MVPVSPPLSQTLGAGESFNYCHYDLEISAARRGAACSSAAVSICIEREEVEEGKKGMKTNIPSPKPQITPRRVTHHGG